MVLVVDDNKFSRQMTAMLLQEHGFQVATAKDGMEALTQVQTTLPDVIVLDVVMPQMSGYEVCRRLKSCAETNQIPVVMYSSSSEDANRYWGFKQGADAYLGKPCKTEDLIAAIRQFCRAN